MMAELFRLVNYSNLPRWIGGCTWYTSENYGSIIRWKQKGDYLANLSSNDFSVGYVRYGAGDVLFLGWMEKNDFDDPQFSILRPSKTSENMLAMRSIDILFPLVGWWIEGLKTGPATGKDRWYTNPPKSTESSSLPPGPERRSLNRAVSMPMAPQMWSNAFTLW